MRVPVVLGKGQSNVIQETQIETWWILTDLRASDGRRLVGASEWSQMLRANMALQGAVNTFQTTPFRNYLYLGIRYRRLFRVREFSIVSRHIQIQ
jgi:hypothetical protein